MSDVVFVKTRTLYDPYQDLFRLAELSGFDSCFVDQVNPHDSSKVYVIAPANGEWDKGWQKPTAKIIHLQLEWEHDIAQQIPGVFEKWTCDAWHAQRLNCKFVPLGSHPDLNLRPSDSPTNEYDVTFLAAPNGRRYSVWGDIADRGLSISPIGWGEDRHDALSKSRCMVIVHQWEAFKCIAPLRWALAAAYKLPIISESVWCRDPFGHGHFMTCDFDRLGKFTELHIRDPYNNLEDYGLALYERLCHQMTFRKSIEAAL